MENVIHIDIFGIEDVLIDSCKKCSQKCSGCGNCNNEKKSCRQNMWQSFECAAEYIKNSDIGKDVIMEFIDIKRDGLENNKNIEKLLLEGYTIPITTIDGVARYYGGISKELIYKDVKELLK